MKDEPVNLPASVLARLRNIAREKHADHQLILRRYAIEGLLHRLCASPHRDRFILKGAMLFTAWLDDPFRPTRDLDLLGYGDPSVAAVDAEIRSVCGVAVDDDGLIFDLDSVRVFPIREGRHYGGVRVTARALLGKTRIPVQVDIGFGDAITPDAQEIEFPALLAVEGPRLKAYPKETVVAEKLQAIVALGRANSRMKDFYDLLALARLFDFDGDPLAAAIRATFERRRTALPVNRPDGLSAAFAEDANKARQWKAFIDREPLMMEAGDLRETIGIIAEFTVPPMLATASGSSFNKRWPAGGPWT